MAVEATTPFSSPWRVLMIGDEPGRLIESNIVLNLNPPSKIADTSWIKAGKSAWDWWSGEAAPSVTFKTGMNTATMKHYIDFASDVRVSLHADRRGLGGGADRTDPDDYAALADITAVVTGNRHAGAASLRQRKERQALAVVALDVGRQVHGPGVSAV